MKKLATSIVLIILGVGVFVYWNITFNYPLNEARLRIIQYKEDNGFFPVSLDDVKNIRQVKAISILRYSNKGDDFLLYYCPTILGPCEVCSKSEEPYFEEI